MKYPRTPHAPFSPGRGKGDRVIKDITPFLEHEALIITEKLDGSNVCLTSDAVFARSHSGPPKHPSFDWLKAKHAEIRGMIPHDVELFCEYTYAVHSIEYRALPSYIWIIGIRRNGRWFSWDELRQASNALKIPTVPFICKIEHGKINAKQLERTLIQEFNSKGLFGDKEGIVIRNESFFDDEDFSSNIMKMVRKDHVQTDVHWTNQPIKVQELVF